MDNAPGEGGRPRYYHSYLLRLWCEGESGGRWRASLHDPRSGERLGFASVDELFGFLRRQMGTAPRTAGGQGRPGTPPRPASREERR
jgi:hypothetical protein